MWSPLRPEKHPEEQPAPFKIGGLDLPMVTFEGAYDKGVDRLASLLVGHYGSEIYPVVLSVRQVILSVMVTTCSVLF